jgi:hypothetical protein
MVLVHCVAGLPLLPADANTLIFIIVEPCGEALKKVFLGIEEVTRVTKPFSEPVPAIETLAP